MLIKQSHTSRINIEIILKWHVIYSCREYNTERVKCWKYEDIDHFAKYSNPTLYIFVVQNCWNSELCVFDWKF